MMIFLFISYLQYLSSCSILIILHGCQLCSVSCLISSEVSIVLVAAKNLALGLIIHSIFYFYFHVCDFAFYSFLFFINLGFLPFLSLDYFFFFLIFEFNIKFINFQPFLFSRKQTRRFAFEVIHSFLT